MTDLSLDIIEQVLAYSSEYSHLSVERFLFGNTLVPSNLKSLVVTQLDVAPRWKSKFPTLADTPFFFSNKRVFEQASSEATAYYKQQFVPNESSFIDLTGGAGIDFLFLAKVAQRAFYFEQNPDVVTATQFNLRPWKGFLPYETMFVCGDSLEFLPQLVHEPNPFIYFDPARRNEHGKRAFLLSDITPNPIEVIARLKQYNYKGQLLIKLSPLYDLQQLLLQIPCASSLHIVAWRDEVKELLLYATSLTERNPLNIPIYAVELCSNGTEEKHFTFTLEEEKNTLHQFAESLGRYLYYPSVALLKSGAYRTLASRFNLFSLHPNSHLYTSDSFEPRFPGKIFLVESVIPYQKKSVRKLSDICPKADITVRNFPISTEKLQAITKISPCQTKRIFATTIMPSKPIFIVAMPVREG